MAICLLIRENDTREYILTANIIIQCSCNTCKHSDGADTLSHLRARTSTEKSHKYCRVLLPLFTRLGVFTLLPEKNCGRGELAGAAGGFMLELAG